ncbi:MAG: alcohol dehydrogenase catalytic domain-containing protein [Clostridiales bacterium]|nr:alcohol dehydrogenase catalytic domain-containing protein [Clostridiales bacterium]OPZ67191.1 MAG: Sorbitol dehydrogenase [Firmicutes bacterium ADurb.Bin467]
MAEIRTMRAAVVTVDRALEVQTVPMPAIGPYDALVKLTYGATCAGTDQRVIDHGHPRPLQYPGILGHESVGRVLEVGEKVASFKPGDLISRVGAPETAEMGACWGGFAEYGVARDWRAMRVGRLDEMLWRRARVNQVIPEDIPERAAPMIITWRETLSYLNRIGVREGARALVLGSGANALAFVGHCAFAGADVSAMGGASREQSALGAGARGYVDYRDPEAKARLRALFPDGIDLVIDAVGQPSGMNAALPLLRAGATVGVYGWDARSGYGINPFLAANSFSVYCGGYDEPETHDEVIRRMRLGALDASVYYDMDNPVPLGEIRSAYRDLLARKAVKYLIDLR